MHHRTIQINHQPDATVCPFIILTFVYSSTCFGRFPAHHQELNDCSGSLWFYLPIMVIAVLCSWSGRPAGPTTNTARLSPRYEGKTRGCHCSHWAPDDGRANARNMLSRSARPRTQHDYHHDTQVKPEATTAVIELLMIGGKTPETCSAANKRQDNKLTNCCIRLVIYLN